MVHRQGKAPEEKIEKQLQISNGPHEGDVQRGYKEGSKKVAVA